MTEHELVGAYVRGQISRRTFIRRLMKLGVSLTAALTYSNVLWASPASASSALDLYNLYCTGGDVVPVVVRDGLFRPRSVTIEYGDHVKWTMSPSNAQNHNVKDKGPVALFDSGPVAPGANYQFQFVAAGRYPAGCGIHPGPKEQTIVTVMPTVSPPAGTTSTTFTITYACKPASTGFIYELWVRRPGQGFKVLQTGTAPSKTFTPDAGPGPYAFRARLRRLSGGASQYAVIAVQVS